MSQVLFWQAFPRKIDLSDCFSFTFFFLYKKKKKTKKWNLHSFRAHFFLKFWCCFCCFLLSHGDEPCCNQCNRVTRLVIFFFLYETLFHIYIFVRHRHNNNEKKKTQNFHTHSCIVTLHWVVVSPVTRRENSSDRIAGTRETPREKKIGTICKKARSISQFYLFKTSFADGERGGGSATTTQASSHPISRNSSASFPHKKTNAVLPVWSPPTFSNW